MIPLRSVTLAATEFGPFIPRRAPEPRRSARVLPRSGAIEDEMGPVARRSLLTARLNPFECGTSWIGESGGLAGSKNNAKGFVDGLKDDGWNVNFNWGDANAWESDWRRNDDTWVDAADFVFYTGHADGNGWVLSKPDDGSLSYTEVGSAPATPGDLWGQQDLEWVVVAACGPFEDDLISEGGGDALKRWKGAFDGLHLMMGYGSVTFDNEDEGATLVEYARDGETIVSSWFRAAKEIQPSTNGYAPPFGNTIYATAMTAWKSGKTSPWNDHLWGHGSVASDPSSPNSFMVVWTPT